MRNYLAKILMNQAGEPNAGAPPATPPSETPPATPPGNPPPKADGDKEYDDLGYEIVKKAEGDPTAPGDKPPKDPTKKPEKVENPVTGYGAEPPKVDDPPPADPNKKVDPPPAPTELEKKLEGLNPGFAALTKQQIDKIGLKGKELDEFIEIKKQEQKEALDWVQHQKDETARQEKIRNAGWHKELKEDPVFGGDNFLLNVTRGEKVLDEYLPELKKELTEGKQMLRPSVMRGLARLADQLYPDDKVVHGDPTPPPGEVDDKNEKSDPLAFYE
jgi:hypothetical protein